jgi:hypothetical protein
MLLLAFAATAAASTGGRCTQVGDWSDWSPSCPADGNLLTRDSVCPTSFQRRARCTASGRELHDKRHCDKQPCCASVLMTEVEGLVSTPRLCGGVAMHESLDAWTMVSSTAILFSVNTSQCRFSSDKENQPVYVTTLIAPTPLADLLARQITGLSSIFAPRSDFFSVVIDARSFKGSPFELLQTANSEKWGVSWLGAIGAGVGRTRTHATGWKTVTVKAGARESAVHGAHANGGSIPSTTIFADVDTSACQYQRAVHPHAQVSSSSSSSGLVFFSSLYGASHSHLARGGSITHNPSSAGFRIYLVSECM